jgi:hypothetical protein
MPGLVHCLDTPIAVGLADCGDRNSPSIEDWDWPTLTEKAYKDKCTSNREYLPRGIFLNVEKGLLMNKQAPYLSYLYYFPPSFPSLFSLIENRTLRVRWEKEGRNSKKYKRLEGALIRIIIKRTFLVRIS